MAEEGFIQLIEAVAIFMGVVVFPVIGLVWHTFKKKIVKLLNLTEEQQALIEKTIENGKESDEWILEHRQDLVTVVGAISAVSPEAKKALEANNLGAAELAKKVNLETTEIKKIDDILEKYSNSVAAGGKIPEEEKGEKLETTARKEASLPPTF
jgi:hypothetical protein